MENFVRDPLHAISFSLGKIPSNQCGFHFARYSPFIFPSSRSTDGSHVFDVQLVFTVAFRLVHMRRRKVQISREWLSTKTNSKSNESNRNEPKKRAESEQTQISHVILAVLCLMCTMNMMSAVDLVCCQAKHLGRDDSTMSNDSRTHTHPPTRE